MQEGRHVRDRHVDRQKSIACEDVMEVEYNINAKLVMEIPQKKKMKKSNYGKRHSNLNKHMERSRLKFSTWTYKN